MVAPVGRCRGARVAESLAPNVDPGTTVLRLVFARRFFFRCLWMKNAATARMINTTTAMTMMSTRDEVPGSSGLMTRMVRQARELAPSLSRTVSVTL